MNSGVDEERGVTHGWCSIGEWRPTRWMRGPIVGHPTRPADEAGAVTIDASPARHQKHPVPRKCILVFFVARRIGSLRSMRTSRRYDRWMGDRWVREQDWMTLVIGPSKRQYSNADTVKERQHVDVYSIVNDLKKKKKKKKKKNGHNVGSQAPISIQAVRAPRRVHRTAREG